MLHSPALLRRYVLGWVPLLLLLVAVLDVGPRDWPVRLLVALPFAVTLPFLSLGYWFVARAHPAGRSSFGRLLAVHGAAAVASAFAWYAVGAGGLLLVGAAAGLDDVGALLAANRALLVALGVCAYAVVVLVCYLLVALGEQQRAALREEELLALAREAELRALEFQVNPHFLFNSLNSISSLATAAPERAREMTVRLGDLLRRTLRFGEARAVPLRDELELVDDYLSLEQMRFCERLVLRREIDPACLAVPVPPLILQPLAENAVKHGIASLLGPMELLLVARREAGADGEPRLRLVVRNGYDPQAAPAARPGAGVGLQNVRARLERFGGEARALEVTRGPDSFEVRLTLPWSEARS